MTSRLQAIAVAAIAGVFAFSNAKASETPYYKSVSDIEVETSVKGQTYDRANDKSPAPGLFGGNHAPGSSSCCTCDTVAGTAAPAPAPHGAPPPVSSADLNERLKTAISQLGTSSWQDARTLLVESGKASIPFLIDALSSSDAAFNLGGHTKSDAGRMPRQRTIGEVAAELLTEIVTYHTSYKGEVPAADQAAWREWWSKNAEGVTVTSN